MNKRFSLMPSIWQRLAIFSVLILLVVNGLPSFWGQHDRLVVTGLSQPTLHQTSQTLDVLLKGANGLGLVVTQGKNGQLSFQFTDHRVDAQQYLRALKQELKEHADVTLDSVPAGPAWFTQISAEPIKLGLDLSGGALFVLEVDTQTAMQERMKAMAQALNHQVREARLLGTRVQVTAAQQLNVIFSETRASSVSLLLRNYAQQYEGVVVTRPSATRALVAFSPERRQQLERQYVDQALTTMRSRIEQLGITEGVIQTQGKRRIRIEIPGIKDLSQAERLIGATASLAFYQLSEHAKGQPRFAISSEKYGRLSLAAKPIFTGTHISDAQMGRDEQGVPLVNLVLDSAGGAKMSVFTKDNIGHPIVTLFSEYIANDKGELVKAEKVINVATIQSQLGSRFSITNMNSANDAQELALLLRAGSLDAPVNIVQKRIINASLGEQNVQNGLLALALGLLMTMVFMLVFYRRLGLVANTALLLNLACLMGLVALTPNAVLTLPGIAGLVLTVGMAVDTNVLIFERIRQERDKGMPASSAMILGYKNAWTTILDANITTLICALVMLSIGYGPVKGFAIALSLGLLTSVFTGVAVSKTLSAYLGPDWLLNWKGGEA